MYIPEGFKTNKFKAVRIPSKGEYFNTGRFIMEKGVYGGENEPASVNEPTKVQVMEALIKDVNDNTKPAEDIPD